MKGKKGDRKEMTHDEFNFRNELSTLVAQKVIPSRIAERLEKKLTDMNVQITKEQLYILVNKIQEAIGIAPSSISSDRSGKTMGGQPSWRESDTDMKQLADSIEEMKERLTALEQHQLHGIKGMKYQKVTPHDIRTSEVSWCEEDLYPLLEIPNDPESVVVLMKWLQYLVDRVGKSHLPDVLGYYVDVGWISDDVRLDAIKYSKGITEEGIHEGMVKESSDLPTKDHLQSLLFIQKLKGVELDERFVGRLEREMEKMAKSLENYHVK